MLSWNWHHWTLRHIHCSTLQHVTIALYSQTITGFNKYHLCGGVGAVILSPNKSRVSNGCLNKFLLKSWGPGFKMKGRKTAGYQLYLFAVKSCLCLTVKAWLTGVLINHGQVCEIVEMGTALFWTALDIACYWVLHQVRGF